VTVGESALGYSADDGCISCRGISHPFVAHFNGRDLSCSDQVRSEFRKANKIASSDVARSCVNGTTFDALICRCRRWAPMCNRT